MVGGRRRRGRKRAREKKGNKGKKIIPVVVYPLSSSKYRGDRCVQLMESIDAFGTSPLHRTNQAGRRNLSPTTRNGKGAAGDGLEKAQN